MTDEAVQAYVALGDSISIDDYAGGPGRGGASLLYRNRDEDFPEWRGRDLASADQELRFHLLATDGATMETVLHRQLPWLASTGIRPTVATLTVGGNDVLSTYGDTREARETIDRVSVGVGTALDVLCRAAAPTGRVVLGTVYDPSDGTGDTARLGLPPWPDAVRVIQELNQALTRVAGERGVAVAEIWERFHGHGVFSGDPARPDPRPSDRRLWYCDVIEPNAWGASGVREAFWAALGN